MTRRLRSAGPITKPTYAIKQTQIRRYSTITQAQIKQKQGEVPVSANSTYYNKNKNNNNNNNNNNNLSTLPGNHYIQELPKKKLLWTLREYFGKYYCKSTKRLSREIACNAASIATTEQLQHYIT
jgi:hypothetical protein